MPDGRRSVFGRACGGRRPNVFAARGNGLRWPRRSGPLRRRRPPISGSSATPATARRFCCARTGRLTMDGCAPAAKAPRCMARSRCSTGGARAGRSASAWPGSPTWRVCHTGSSRTRLALRQMPGTTRILVPAFGWRSPTHRRPPHRRRGGRSRFARVRCRSSTIRGEGSGFAWAGYMRLFDPGYLSPGGDSVRRNGPARLRWSWRAVHARARRTRPRRGDGARLQFLEVTGDSRCPADALCIQGGGCPGPRARERRDDDALRTPHGGQQPRHRRTAAT